MSCSALCRVVLTAGAVGRFTLRLQETMQRQVKLTTMDKTGKSVNKDTGKEYTEDELELMVAQCLETGTSPFMAGLAQTALEDVLRKHEEIVQIERSVEEVAQLFQDLAIMVSAQGEQLDRIDAHVRAVRPARSSHFDPCVA